MITEHLGRYKSTRKTKWKTLQETYAFGSSSKREYKNGRVYIYNYKINKSDHAKYWKRVPKHKLEEHVTLEYFIRGQRTLKDEP